MSPEKASRLRDNLFTLRCAAEDIATASSEGAPASDITALAWELVALARRIEKLR
ncbi:hypothetical protein CUTER_05355 [Corynebacterium uterequi]|uniref:Uncharacterized protein n=2 Tax=Corynebacterium uterequi TaxID=1072256 RepID=A0A0G3HGJ9_9CORY|nr:hypothetical protein CUTER_05355 [Corynebacterium uterequi]